MSSFTILIGTLAGAAVGVPVGLLAQDHLPPRIRTAGGIGVAFLTGLFAGAATTIALNQDGLLSTLSQKQFVQKCLNTPVPADYKARVIQLPGKALTCRIESDVAPKTTPLPDWQNRARNRLILT